MRNIAGASTVNRTSFFGCTTARGFATGSYCWHKEQTGIKHSTGKKDFKTRITGFIITYALNKLFEWFLLKKIY